MMPIAAAAAAIAGGFFARVEEKKESVVDYSKDILILLPAFNLDRAFY